MGAFDQAWKVVKMPPYYHGTSSANIDSIKERGIIPPTTEEEANWDGLYHSSDYISNDDVERWGEVNPVFMSAEPLSAMHYAVDHGKEEDPSNRKSPHRPAIYEISDDVEGLEGFDFNPEYHDFRVREPIPPEMLRLVHQGSEYEEPEYRPKSLWNYALDRKYDELKESEWYKQYMAMDDKRQPPFVVREGLY